MTNQPTISRRHNGKNPTPQQVAATKLWQSFLKVNPDGNFGPKTEEATKAYQNAHNLKPDGEVGPKTWATVPNNYGVATPTPKQKVIQASNAATTAANTIKQAAAAVAAPKPVAPKPVTVPILNVAVPQPVVAATATAKKAVTDTAAKVQTTVARTQVVYKSQPLAIRIIVGVAAALGTIAGVKALMPERRRSA